MGYKRSAPTTLLKWAEGQPLHGLEVEMRELSLDAFLAMMRLMSSLKVTTTDDMVAAAGAVGELFSRFSRQLVAWNLEDDDGPVPATEEGVQAQGLNFILDLVQQWTGAVTGVGPTSRASSNGTPPSVPAPQIPMEPLSPHPSS